MEAPPLLRLASPAIVHEVTSLSTEVTHDGGAGVPRVTSLEAPPAVRGCLTPSVADVMPATGIVGVKAGLLATKPAGSQAPPVIVMVIVVVVVAGGGGGDDGGGGGSGVVVVMRVSSPVEATWGRGGGRSGEGGGGAVGGSSWVLGGGGGWVEGGISARWVGLRGRCPGMGVGATTGAIGIVCHLS